MMDTRYLLAHDIGTSGDKATLFSTEGELIGSVTSGYGTDYFNNNWAEQDPSDWWNAVCLATRRLVSGIDPGEIAAISLSGQMMGCLCVDRQGRPLRKSIIYCDQRGVKQARELAEKAGEKESYRITGHRLSASYSVEKFMWIRENEPETYRNTYKMLHAKDYINFKFTGKLATEFSDASGMNLLDINTLEWSDVLLDASGIDGEKLPELKASTDVVGELTREAAEELGLVPGIPVIAGAGDGLCAGVGVGSVKPGITYNYIGSSSWIATTTKEPVFDEQMRTFVWAHAVPGYVHPCGTTQTAGSSYVWLKDQIATLEKAFAEDRGYSPYDLINLEIEKSPPGARGLIFLPYLMGERTPRWNPDAKGAFIGLTLEHRREDLMRAVLEGVAMNLSVILDIFRKSLSVEEIIVMGGGAKGDVWRRIMADVYQAEILRPDYLEEATSMGAAIIGGVGSGIFPDFDVVDRFIRIQDRMKPDPRNVPEYERAKEVFERCYQALEPVFPEVGVTKQG